MIAHTEKPSIFSRVLTRFGYDAAEDSTRRKAVANKITSEDAVLPARKRDKLSATTRETMRNFALLGWMARKHLDYTTSFQFRSRNGETPSGANTGTLDDDINALMTEWMRPQNCHTAGRHSFAKLLRLSEAHALADGDIGLALIKDGTIQPVEADLIRDDPTQKPGERWANGCRVNTVGRTVQYGIHKRTDGYNAREFVRRVRAENLILHGNFDRFDQVRGISPLAAALNPLRDVHENFDYALAKAKVSQLFALIIKSNAVEGFGTNTNTETDPDADPKYKVKFGNAPQKLELDPGDDASVLESNQPSTQFQDFTRYMIDVCLKALDIPYSFFDESHTNFFGSRGAMLNYNKSCEAKRANLLELLRRITVWRLSLWIADGTLRLPRTITLREIRFDWIPRGTPWWDPSKEIRGDLLAIGAGLDTPQRICRERDRGNWFENIDEIARARAYAEAAGVPIAFSPEGIGQPEASPQEPPK